MSRFAFGGVALAATLALWPFASGAVTVDGFFDGGDTLTANDFALGSAREDPFVDFAGTTGVLTALEDLELSATVTVNPFLTALNKVGLSNSILVGFQINGGPLTAIALTQTANTGAGQIVNILLSANDTISFVIDGVAGRSGNEVTVNVLTEALTDVPLPASLVLMLAAMGMLASQRRRSPAA